jgi:hypothetical protein
MLLTRFLLKPMMYKILPWFYDIFHFHGRRFLPHLSRKDKMNVRNVMKPFPSLSELHGKDNKRPPHDVDIPTKYIVYAAMTFNGLIFANQICSMLNLI